LNINIESIPFYKMKYTRYLYLRDEVQYSLLISLLTYNESKDEIFFWAYELYFSGWEQETMDFVLRIYSDFYQILYPGLSTLLSKKYKEWKKTRNPCLLGTILHNLAKRSFCPDAFLQTYLPQAFQPSNHIVSNVPIKRIIVMVETELEIYKTKEFDRPWQTMPNVCRYSTRRPHPTIFAFQRKENLISRFREKWLYDAVSGGTPIWQKITHEYGGILNPANESIDFSTEEQEEAFYNRYNYEVDEHPMNILEKCVGTENFHEEFKIWGIESLPHSNIVNYFF